MALVSQRTSTALPVLDMEQPLRKVADAVRDASTTYGFFYVINHGIRDDVIAEYFDQCRAFFDLPLEAKMEIRTDSNNRGYTPFGEERLDPATQNVGDTKEGLYFGREISHESAESRKPLHGPNQWPCPSRLPAFRPAVEKYFQACTKLGNRLLDALSLSLDMETDWFRKRFDQPMLFLRPLHYAPELSDPEKGVYGAGAHTDYGMLTILATDGTPGLQILHKRTWMDVLPVRGALLVNLGDLLERWTNGKYKSTVHRVMNKLGKDRYSSPFFFEPNFDAAVHCLPSCSKEEPPRYPPTTAGEHLLAKYAATHAAFGKEGDGD